MLYTSTLSEVSNNINTGVEYEIALFYKLLRNQPNEQTQVMNAINRRYDVAKVKSIIAETDTSSIERALSAAGFVLVDASFETQNDEVGPADIVMHVTNRSGQKKKIGLSVKYANTCTLTNAYGNVNNWFRKRKPSNTTDQYIDLIRDAVIANWRNVRNKTTLLSALFHSDSPIEFWVVTYGNYGYTLKTKPQTIDMSRANDVTVGKYQTSYVAFYLDGIMVGHMQVKFNNGFVEKCKKLNPDVVCQGVEMAYGQPFSSWNFSVEK